jgi:aquaporin Z
MEAAGLGLFMFSACVVTVLVQHPMSALNQSINSPVLRRVLIGIAMGLTAIAIICSPWGKRSGAHLNPSFTLAFFALGKIRPWDAVFYVTAQLAGGILGVLLADLLIGPPLRHTSIDYAVTVPGPAGIHAAFAGEFVISALLMSVVLFVSNSRRLSRFTPFFAGALVAVYIAVESPFSGMSMNPARTLASAFSAREWTAIWIYFIVPPAAMLLAGQLYRFRRGAHRVFCAKLYHHNETRCIFRCNYGELQSPSNRSMR